MNFLRTAMLLAALTAIFMGVGYLIGGIGRHGHRLRSIAAGMNLFTYWNADKMVLSMHARPRGRRAHRAGVLWHRPRPRRSAPACRCRASMSSTARSRTPSPPAAIPRTPPSRRPPASSARCRREEIAGVMAHELGHVKNRDTLTMTITATIAGAISMLANFAFFFGGSRDNNNPLGFVGVLVAAIVAPLAAAPRPDGDQPDARIFGRPRGAEITGQPAWLASALGKIARAAARSRTRRPSATRRRRISSSSIRCPARAWTISSRPTRRPRTASPRSRRWRASSARGGRRAHRRTFPASAARVRPMIARAVPGGKAACSRRRTTEPGAPTPRVLPRVRCGRTASFRVLDGRQPSMLPSIPPPATAR